MTILQLLGTPILKPVGFKQLCKRMVDRELKRSESHPANVKRPFSPHSTETIDLSQQVNNSINIVSNHRAKIAICARYLAHAAAMSSLKCLKMTIDANQINKTKLSLREIITQRLN